MQVCAHRTGSCESNCRLPPDPKYNIQEELIWGLNYRQIKEREKRTPMPPKRSPMNIPFRICRAELLAEVKGKKRKKKHDLSGSGIKLVPKLEKITLLDRNVMSQPKYMRFLSKPNPKFYLIDERLQKKPKRRCELEPCPPRFVQLAVPNKRRVFANWKDYQDFLPAEMLLRFEEILHTDLSLEPRQARNYYKYLDKKKRLERRRKRLLKKKKQRQKERGEKAWMRQEINDTVKVIVDYIKDEPLFALTYKQLLLSDGILERLEKTHVLKKKIKRKTRHPFKKTVVEISDKCAVWLDTLTRFVDVQAVESDEDIPPLSISSLSGEEEEESEGEYDEDEEGEFEAEETEEEESEGEGEYEYSEEGEESGEKTETTVWDSDIGDGEMGLGDDEFLGLMGKSESRTEEEKDGEMEVDQELDELGAKSQTVAYDEDLTGTALEDDLTGTALEDDLTGRKDVIEDIFAEALDFGEATYTEDLELPEDEEETTTVEESVEEATEEEEEGEEELEEGEEKEEAVETIMEPPTEEEFEGKGIKGHKPSVTFAHEHDPNAVCCLSLKTWAVWLLEITHNAHNWTKWISDIIRQIRQYAATVRGDIKNPDGTTKQLKKSEWRKFCKDTEEGMASWKEYSDHVKALSKSIIEHFHNKKVYCCPLCLQDNLIPDVVLAHKTLQALTEAITSADYWQRTLDQLVQKTAALVSGKPKEEEEEEEKEEGSSSEETEGTTGHDLEECPVPHGSSSEESIFELEELDVDEEKK